jgi:hypothetical protein
MDDLRDYGIWVETEPSRTLRFPGRPIRRIGRYLGRLWRG